MESGMAKAHDPLSAFIEASVWHGSLEKANVILSAHPEIAGASIHAAAILGDEVSVRRFLALDPASATAKGGPGGWDALTHLCFSRYLRLDRARSDGFMRAATALIEAGAKANTGFHDTSHQPRPVFESALYGAAGVAHHVGLTRLLLERGADPNDEEVPYHSPESYDNDAMQAVVASGKLTADNLATMLLRKADWHDFQGIKWLLEHGAEPNRMTRWRVTPLQQAVRRDNSIESVQVMLDHGGDPSLPTGVDGRSAAALAALRGRGDLLALFERRGSSLALLGVEGLLAACAREDAAAVRAIAEESPELVAQLKAHGGHLLATFAGNGNTGGVRQLLELGVDIQARLVEGDGYFGVAKESTALHIAAWRARHDTVKFLIARGAAIEARDDTGGTPLALAVRACVDSYWAYRRSPESVQALLQAGASVKGVPFPSGYREVDELLRAHGAAA